MIRKIHYQKSAIHAKTTHINLFKEVTQQKTCFMPYHNLESKGEFPLEGIFTLLILVDKLRILISHIFLKMGPN